MMTDPAAAGRADRLALAALLLGACCIGFSPIFVRLSEIGPVATAFHRVLLALPLFGLLLAGRPAPAAAPAPRGVWLAVAASGVCLAGDLALWHLALAHVSVVNATLLANLAPVFVTAAAWLWLGERISARFLGGLALAVAGVGALVLGGAARPSATDGRTLLGVVQALAAAAFYAGYILAIKRVRHSLPVGRAMLASGAATALALLPLVFAFGEPLFASSVYGWSVLLGLAWVSQGAGQGCIAYGLARLPASFSSLTLLVQPVVAALLAWWLFAEALSGVQALGALGVLAGIRLAGRR